MTILKNLRVDIEKGKCKGTSEMGFGEAKRKET